MQSLLSGGWELERALRVGVGGWGVKKGEEVERSRRCFHREDITSIPREISMHLHIYLHLYIFIYR